ncbi:MAG: hypothetical protein ACUVQI_06015 [Thermochromatium sp.]
MPLLKAAIGTSVSTTVNRRRPPPSIPLQARSIEERAATLALIANTLAQRTEWRSAIRANRASLALVESPERRRILDQQIAEHGFRIAGHKVESEATSPRICIQFTDPLDLNRPNLTDFVQVVARNDLPIEAESKQICGDGVRHGERYQLLEADIQVRVLEEGGQPVERRLRRPVTSKQARIGLKPLFEGSGEEGGNARFEVIAIDPQGLRRSLTGALDSGLA